MSSESSNTTPSTSSAARWESELLVAIRALKFGSVEVVVHDGEVAEIRQTKRIRLHGKAKAHRTDVLIPEI